MLEISRVGENLVISPSGDWTLAAYDNLQEICRQKFHTVAKPVPLNLEIDGSQLTALDTTGANSIVSLIASLDLSLDANKKNNISLKNFNPESRKLFELVWERLNKFNALPKAKDPVSFSFFASIGLLAFNALIYLREIFSFLGLVTEGLVQMLLRPKLFRPKELITQLEEACIKSIPVVSLVTCLIGIVVAYLMAMQIEKYGGHIFVVNGVALAMCRELSPIIVAVVMAGRSGSAYTAQIGAMRLNEEVDAITAIGLSPMHVLVIPRLLALVISMPLLVFIGDLVGIWGGMVIAQSQLGVTYTTFIERLHIALPVKHFIVGMVKAPVFAAVIALIGCRRGLTTAMNARSVGISTTATVVESIVLVILLNAAFAVIFARLGI